MRRPSALRTGLALAAIALLGVALVLALQTLTSAWLLWQRLQASSPALLAVYATLLAAFACASAAVLWWLLRSPPAPRQRAPEPPDEHALTADILRHTQAGVDTRAARRELDELRRRRSAGELVLALFGEVSSGKSSLIRALIPQARPVTDVRAGTTRHIRHYRWRGPSGDRLVIADVPGFNDAADEVTDAAMDEAVRAHVVVYVCDGDLTRPQWQELDVLREFGKPLVVALNKMDRYASDELEAIRKRLRERFGDDTEVAPVQAGGEEEVIRRLPDGREERLARERSANTDALVRALQRRIDADEDALAMLRDNAVLLLAAGKLERAVDDHRRDRAREIVARHTRHAVVGGLAALSPGSDVVIQGALAARLAKELSDLYDIPARRIDIEATVRAASERGRKLSALAVAVAGNALKAFPGPGTVTGGLMHAVAYGLLFDALARALAHTLRTRGELRPRLIARTLEDKLGEDLAARAKALAKIALAERTHPQRQS